MHFNEKHLTKPIKCRGAYTLHSKTICQFCVHKEVDTEVLSAFSSQLKHFNCVCNKFGARFLLCFSCCVSNSCFFIQRQQINRKNIVGTFDVRVCFFLLFAAHLFSSLCHFIQSGCSLLFTFTCTLLSHWLHITGSRHFTTDLLYRMPICCSAHMLMQ